jgi:hypothetical protein
MLLWTALIASPPVASAGPLSLNYTVFGTGGTSAPVAGVSAEKFWWIDTTGTAPPSTVESYGFRPFEAFAEVAYPGGGSLLVSSAFTLTAAETLVIDYRMLSGNTPDLYNFYDGTAPVGFALLLKSGVSTAVLANLTAEGENYFNNVPRPDISPSASTFTPTSAGVSSTMTIGSGLDVTLDGIRYANPAHVAGPCGCYMDVTSTYTPGAGTYQILFGVNPFYNTYPSQSFNNMDAALAVIGVQATPEPATIALVGLGLSMALARSRRRSRL